MSVSFAEVDRVDSETHLADLLAGEAGTFDLLLILGRLLERLSQVVDRKVGDVRADAESLDAVRVKVLVAKEGLDDGGKTGCPRKLRVSSRRSDGKRKCATYLGDWLRWSLHHRDGRRRRCEGTASRAGSI